MNNAITPYNFVPMPDRIVEAESFSVGEGKKQYVPDADRYYAARHTGWFDVTLTTLTPIYTRAGKALGEAPDKLSEKFFQRADGAYVLPGSGLRGMIRSLFEIMTYSDMEFVSSRRLFYRSFADSKGDIRRLYTERFRKERLLAGLLVEEGGKLWLRVSKKSPKGFVVVRASTLNTQWTQRGRSVYPLPRPVRVAFADDTHEMIGAEIANIVQDGKSDTLKGWLIVPGMDVPKRGGEQRSWFQVIIEPGQSEDDSEMYEVPADVYADYLAWGEMAHGSRFRDDKLPRRAPRKLEAGVPAFALLNPDEAGQVAAIGANMMMPLRYGNSIADVARRSVRGNPPEMDMAQAVFGRVREGKSESDRAERKNKAPDMVRGRVFFEDAVCTERGEAALLDARSPTKYPDVLSGPKPTAFQIYLAQPNSYTLQHWDIREARLSGRKIYWHRPASAAKATLHDYKKEGVSDTQTTQIQPLREGLTFTGRVRFENLTDAELGALYASLRLPRGLAHKFGMGKNLGLGSVRVEIKQTCLLDFARRLRSLAPDAGKTVGAVADETLQRAYAAFVQHVFPKSTTLWNNQRMVSLAALLSWDSMPDERDTQQIPFGEQWRYRLTLPQPQKLTGIQGVTDVFSLRQPDTANGPVTAPQPVAAQSGASQPSSRQPDSTKQVSTQPATQPKAARPVTTPPAPTKKTYKVGEKAAGRVVQRDGATGQGQVELLDGTKAKASSLFTCAEGESYMFRITKVDNNGGVKEVVR